MPAIGMGLLWGGYSLLLWGYCQVRGYDISLTDLVVPGRYTGKWPPPLIQDSATPQVDPNQHPGDMPNTYPTDPNGASASAPGKGTGKGNGTGKSKGTGGILQA